MGIEKVEVDGVVVTVPPEVKAYLIFEHPIKGKVIEPVEKVPPEERIAEILKRAGAGAEEIGKRISEVLTKRKEEVKEVV